MKLNVVAWRVCVCVLLTGIFPFALRARAEAVKILRSDDIPEVAAKVGCVQEQLIHVRSALQSAKRDAKDGWVLLVKTAGALDDDRLFNDALDHFAGGCVKVCAPEEALAKLTELEARPRLPSTVTPAAKWNVPSWRERCALKQKEIEANESRVFDVVFFGDSITHNWERDDAWGIYAEYGGFGASVWKEAFKGLKLLNIGIGGDRTENLLWRGLNGDLDNYKARMFVLMIGSNNVRSNDPLETAAGVKVILELLKAKHPESKIVLYAIFPRGEKADDGLRVKNEKVNAIIREYADGETVFWRDINAQFLNADGTMERKMMPDFLHPTPTGYTIWANDLKPLIEKFRAQPMDAKNLKTKETEISKLLAIGDTLEKKFAWRPVPEITPEAPSLHDGRINYFQVIRSRIAAASNGVDVVFYSDGPADGFNPKGAGKSALEGPLRGLKVLNITVGETMNQILWNALTGDFDGYKAKVVVLSVNPGHEVHEKRAAPAVEKLLGIVRQKQPQATIILTPACPGGADVEDEMRKRNLRFNAAIRKFTDGKKTVWCDYTEGFCEKDGTLSKTLLAGEFRPTAAGYLKWGEAVKATIEGCPPAVKDVPPPSYPETELTLMSYNIRHGQGMDDYWDLGRTVDVIKKVRPDVLAMQEVDSFTRTKSFGADEPTMMGHILHPMWRCRFAPAYKVDGGEYGVATLSAEEPLSTKILELPGVKEPRRLLAVEFEKYWVATTHLSLHEEKRLESVPIIADFAKTVKKPFFVAGDWNAEPSTKTIAEMAKHFTILSDTNRFTFTAGRPHATIDYIAVDNAHAPWVKVKSCSVLDEPAASDHLPIVLKCAIMETQR